MERIIDDLKQPSWWFTVILIGLGINILAAYLKPVIDKVLAKISVHHKRKNLEKQQKRKELISLLLQDRFKILEYRLTLVYFSILLVFYFLLALAFLSLMLYVIDEPQPYSLFEITLSVLFFLAFIYEFRVTHLTLIHIFEQQSILDEVSKEEKLK